MDAPERAPLCANQIHVEGVDRSPEPTNLCRCEAGLIHMHDCPVSVGLECIHFREADDDLTLLPMTEQEELRQALMQDYLSRDYYHRLRSLSPAGDPRQLLKEDLAARAGDASGEEGAEEKPEESEEQMARADSDYERDKERLITQRKKREEKRLEQEARNRDQKAQERARRGIKTVVEKAQETVAAQGNVVVSYLDEIKLPEGEPGEKKRRRPRRKGKPSGGSGQDPARKKREGEGGDRPRRRRRGRGRGKAAPTKPHAEGSKPAAKESKPAAKEGGRPSRRRRRRGRGKSGGGGSGGAAPSA